MFNMVKILNLLKINQSKQEIKVNIEKYLFALKVIIIATIVIVRVIVDDINLWKVLTILFCTCVWACIPFYNKISTVILIPAKTNRRGYIRMTSQTLSPIINLIGGSCSVHLKGIGTRRDRLWINTSLFSSI